MRDSIPLNSHADIKYDIPFSLQLCMNIQVFHPRPPAARAVTVRAVRAPSGQPPPVLTDIPLTRAIIIYAPLCHSHSFQVRWVINRGWQKWPILFENSKMILFAPIFFPVKKIMKKIFIKTLLFCSVGRIWLVWGSRSIFNIIALLSLSISYQTACVPIATVGVTFSSILVVDPIQ